MSGVSDGIRTRDVQILLDLGVRVVDECTDMSERLPAPVPKFLDLLVD
ncbi:MAG: hypothetical protein ACRD3T_15660 [Terriglobia bacterium]